MSEMHDQSASERDCCLAHIASWSCCDHVLQFSFRTAKGSHLEIQAMLEVPLPPHVVSTALEVLIDCSSKIDMVSC